MDKLHDKEILQIEYHDKEAYLKNKSLFVDAHFLFPKLLDIKDHSIQYEAKDLCSLKSVLSDKKDYPFILGYQFAEKLKKIHAIHVNQPMDCRKLYQTRLDKLFYELAFYQVQYDNLYLYVDFVQNHSHLLQLACSNFIVKGIFLDQLYYYQGEVSFFDFANCGPGDYHYDLVFLHEVALYSEEFAQGFMESYFQKEKNSINYRLMAIFAGEQALQRLLKLYQKGGSSSEIENTVHFLDSIIEQYDDFTSFIPNWIDLRRKNEKNS